MSTRPPRVAVCMGSTTDLPVMRQAADTLAEFGVSAELRVLSAHRTPEAMLEFARTAASRGFEVLIAGAGGAAHLPGMLASATRLPVIGVPVPVGPLVGIDALVSIVQMPGGVPVATVAIGAAHNAAMLAVRILALNDESLGLRLDAYREEQARKVFAADAALAAGEAAAGALAGQGDHRG